MRALLRSSVPRPPSRLFALQASHRLSTVSAFTAAVEQLQAQQRAIQTAAPLAGGIAGGAEIADRQSKLHQVQRQGKQLFDSDTIDIAPPAPASSSSGSEDGKTTRTSSDGGMKEALSPEVAAKISQAAVQWHISPLRGQPYAEVLNWSMSAAAEPLMDIHCLARIIHSALVLRAPQLYPVLITYIPLLLKTLSSPTAPHHHQLRDDPATLAVVINAYGRAGVHHDILYEKLCSLGEEVLKDPTVSIAHVANVTHALAKVNVVHRGILSTLRNQAVRQKQSASPLMSITLLSAFAELSFRDEEFFTVYEEHLLEHVKQLTPPLLASLLHSLVMAERTSASPSAAALLQRIDEQITSTAQRFDAFPIAKVMSAYFASGKYSEEALGALAERACAVASDFRSEEVTQVLEALSALDLFDGELFPLLASRIATLVKQAAPITIEDAASVLASFAAVQESSDELQHWCGKVFTEYADASVLSADAYINVIWGCLTLNIRSEAQKKFVESVKANPQLLHPLPGEKRWHKPKKAIMEERRAKIIKAYGIKVA